MNQRLHLAASRFERLLPKATNLLCQPGWVHLGEPPIQWKPEIQEQFAFGCYGNGLRLAAACAYRKWRPRYTPEQLEKFYASCEFLPFHYEVGGRLDFEDGHFTFALSEHFFEHLTLPEAISLLKECYRIMAPGGVIRTSVPDADYRSYLPIEKPGFPSAKVPWTHHQKHKMRWNVTSFSEVLRLAGWTPQPVIYCTADGTFHEQIPTPGSKEYAGCQEMELVGTTDYLRRMPSLVVDGVKAL